ncbi:MAG: outer membrane beta-barrel protein [Verrucomicrobiota bacterium]
MRKSTTLIAATAIAALSNQAFGLFSVMGGEVGVSLTARYGYDSNINANNGQEGDDILTVTPAVTFIRERGIISLEAGASVSFQFFNDTGSDRNVLVLTPGGPTIVNQGGNDSIDPSFYLKLSGPNGIDSKTSYSALVGIQRTSEANDLVGQRTTSWNYNGTLDIIHRLNDKYGVGVTPFFQYQQYRGDSFGDVLSTGASVDGQYYYSEKLSFDAGYRFRYQHTDSVSVPPRSALESFDHTLFVGAFGVLAPKITGNAQFGVTYRDYTKSPGLSDYVYPFINMGLDYAFDEKTVFSLTADADGSQSPGSQGLRQIGAGVSARHQFIRQLSATAGFNYTHSFLDGNGLDRTDDNYAATANVKYDINKWAFAAIDARYQFNGSDNGFFRYDRWQIFGSLGVQF